jgi:hypothetical protein
VSSTDASPRFLAGVQNGWHAVETGLPLEAGTVTPGCAAHAWAACGDLVRPALADGGEPRPYDPATVPQSHDPCPACRWIVAARTGSLDSTLALLADPLEQRIARGILRRAAMDEKDPDDPETMHLLAAVGRHSPVGLVAEECSEGDCDHDGRCPSTHACRACSLQAGSWAGEWEGQYMDECTIPAPCAPLLALAAHFGVKP